MSELRKKAEESLAGHPNSMSQQTAAFLRVTGDMWYEINVNDLGKDDPVSFLIENSGIKPTEVLEIGCANGWRLRKLKERYDCRVMGIEPSPKAVEAGLKEGLTGAEICIGTADYLAFNPDNHYDVVIYGYCFSYIDPALYFKVMHEGDRVLKDGGWLIIHDRISPFPIKRNYARIEQKNGRVVQAYAYEMDFSRLWTAHPFYTEKLHARDPDRFENVVMLQKNMAAAFLPGANRATGKMFEYD